MVANLKKPFDASCCDGGQGPMSDMSCMPCGCDKGANHKCEQHLQSEETKNKPQIFSRCKNTAVTGLKLCQKHREYAARKNASQPIEQRRKTNKRRRSEIKLEVLSHYGPTCRCCGEKNIEFLTIDHIKGNGAAHRKLGTGGGSSLQRWLKRNKFPSGFRILCANCNLAMGVYGKCPHGTLKPQRTNHPANPLRIKI